MTYATVADVSTRLGRPIDSPEEQAQVGAWLGDVESLIRLRVPNLDDRVAAGEIPPGTVVMIETNAVIRKMTNPDGKVSETIDDYTYRYNETARKGDLFLTDDDWALLLAQSGAFSVRPDFEPDAARGEPWL